MDRADVRVCNAQPLTYIMEQHFQAIVTVLSLANPLICGAMFAQIEEDQASTKRMADATKAAVAVLIILVIAALAGARVLKLFGVSLDAFSIAGGGVLSWIGFSMLRGNSSPVSDAARDRNNTKRSLTPVILFAASPGTITGVITLAVVHTKLSLPVTALVAVAVATAIMWVAMVLLGRREARPGGGLLHDTVTRFMGLIVVAMGTQFALTGARDFFTAPPQ
jgi:multiple antibiotic resistance protein